MDFHFNINAAELPRLRAASDREAFDLHLAALDWRLIEPIIIHSAEDLKGTKSWRENIKPFDHQVRNLMTFCRRLPVSLIADDVGLGKTISAGLIVAELLARRRITKVLVVCPSLLVEQWEEELSTKFGIAASAARGKKFELAVDKTAQGTLTAVVTTYETLLSKIADINATTFDMIILDEAHKLRNLHSGGDKGKKAPQIATAVRGALAERRFKYVLLLTATPIQNRLWDLYSLIDLLTVAKGHKNPLGTPVEFKNRYIADPQSARRLRPERIDEFRGIMSQYLARTRRSDAQLPFPTREVFTRKTAQTVVERELFTIAASIIEPLGVLQQISLGQALMSSPQAFITQLEAMRESRSKGITDVVIRRTKTLVANAPPPAKLALLLKIATELRSERPVNWRCVVFTGRRSTQRLIVDALAANGIRAGTIAGGAPIENRRSLHAFRSEPPEVNVIVSTDAGAEGVNLQASNLVINYDLPWNPMVLEQRIGRVQRLGSKFDAIGVINLVLADSVEERVVGRLLEKLAVIAQTIGDVEAILEASDLDSDDGSNESFASRIREMVVQAILGYDVEAAERKIEASIEKAQATLEENREHLEQTLGNLNAIHGIGPAMPKLERRPPRLPVERFVVGALQSDGATVNDLGNGIYRAELPSGEPVSLTFDPEVFSAQREFTFGPAMRLYVPGQTHFERLVQRWSERNAALVHRISVDEAAERRLALTYLSRFPGAQIISVESVSRTPSFLGRASAHVRASVAHDSFEKVVEFGLGDPSLAKEFEDVDNDAAVAEGEVETSTMVSDGRVSLARAVRSDPDVAQFCRFYQARLDEEIRRVGPGWNAAKRIEADFKPTVFAEVAAIEGAIVPLSRINVSFRLNDAGPYNVLLSGFAALNRITDEPELAACEETGERVPPMCLSRCEMSNRNVLEHLTEPSDMSGRRALVRFVITCPVSGLRLLADETIKSSVSGIEAATDQFEFSAISKRPALRSEMVTCSFTGARVLPSELALSQVSGRMFRADERGACAVSGKSGHRSEFVNCELTGDVVLESESVVSFASGRRARRDRSTVCGLYGHVLLDDEVALCEETGRMVDKRLLGQSAVSGKQVLHSTLVTSTISGRPALPSETTICAETGATLLPDEVAVCAATGAAVDRRLVGVCTVSAKPVLARLLVASTRSGRLGLPEEMVTCAESGVVLHPDETVICEATRRRVDLNLVGRSDVSGRVILDRLLVESAAGGRRAMADELVTCDETKARLLPDEVATCESTARVVDRRLIARSDISGQLVLQRLLVPCAVTGDRGTRAELVKCELTKTLVRPSEVATCAVTKTIARKDALVRSAASGRWYVRDVCVVSAASGLTCGKDEAQFSEWSREPFLPKEMGRCTLTGLRVGQLELSLDSRLRLLAEVIDGQRTLDAPDHSLPAAVQSIKDHPLRGAAQTWVLSGPHAEIGLVVQEFHQFLGLKKRWVARVVVFEPAPPKAIGLSVNLARRRVGFETSD